MLRSCVLAIVVLAMALLYGPPLAGQDMVLNGNFEFGAYGPWTLFNGNVHASVMQWDVDGVGGPTWCLERKPGKPNDNGGIAQELLLIGGVTYVFDADIAYYSC